MKNLKILGLLAFSSVSISAQAGDYLIAVCPLEGATKSAQIVLHTDAAKSKVMGVSIRGAELTTQTTVNREKASLFFSGAQKGMFQMILDDQVDGRSVNAINLHRGIGSIATDDEMLQGDLGVTISFANSEMQHFEACNLVNEALLLKLAKKQ